MNKQLQPDCVVSANLQNLSKELWENAQRNGGTVTQSAQAIAFKINSCLYRPEYPSKGL